MVLYGLVNYRQTSAKYAGLNYAKINTPVKRAKNEKKRILFFCHPVQAKTFHIGTMDFKKQNYNSFFHLVFYNQETRPIK
jgi:hypothetical protein